jgi:hypothetical protein
MYKVHRPHLAAGYLAQVRSTATTDADGQPDWLLHYTPGPKARAEYAAFMRQPGVETARPRPEDAEPADLLALVMPETLAAEPAEPPHPQAEALVQQFYQRFHGLAQVTPTAKDVNEAWVAGTLAVDAWSPPAAETGARRAVSADLYEAWEECVAIMLADGHLLPTDAARLAWEGLQGCAQALMASHAGQDGTHA